MAAKPAHIGYKSATPGLLLLAVVDHNLCIRWFDIASPGSRGDTAALSKTTLHWNSCSSEMRARIEQLLVAATGQEPPEVQVDAEVQAETAEFGRSADTFTTAQAFHAVGSMLANFHGGDQPAGGTEASEPAAAAAAASAAPAAPAAAESVPQCIPPGYVLVGDAGVPQAAYLLTVGTDHDIKAFRRHDQTLGDQGTVRSVLSALAYSDFVISSTRIHVERAFGLLVNRFKVLRCGRYPPALAREITTACVAVHIFVLHQTIRTAAADLQAAAAKVTEDAKVVEAAVCLTGVPGDDESRQYAPSAVSTAFQSVVSSKSAVTIAAISRTSSQSGHAFQLGAVRPRPPTRRSQATPTSSQTCLDHAFHGCCRSEHLKCPDYILS